MFMAARDASDMHLIAGVPPRLRVFGELMSVKMGPMTPEKIKGLVYTILDYHEIERFEQTRAMDKSFEIEGLARYRINLHWQRDSIGVSVRALPIKVPGFDELGIPGILKDFALKASGIVLVTGPAGSGKSTTLAAIIEHINTTRAAHIVTIEDPIEYVFASKKSLIRQRELGHDTLSLDEALKSLVRQDPNVILIGEMRDLDTIQAALMLAETGHLVLSTLHTQDAAHSINRVVDVFPIAYQREVRTKLSLVLEGVIVQQLIPRKSGGGRVLACEILNCTPSIRSLIRDNNLAQVRSFIQMGRQHGMKSMNQSLLELYNDGVISWEDACLRSGDREELARLVPDQKY
ncbi:MAG: PilT/PilU family type 4a pilus ATPase [Candidatus Omnitrophica bacterium]|nr:PilT/PilU family type 4a pilus ATPase [Candidatus Omnitrophota bacterium]